MTKSDITRRPYREGDEKGINELFNRVFSQNRSLEEWEWKYKDNPAVIDPSEWIMVLEKEKAIVGHYASMPSEMFSGGSVVMACQPVDTIIDPEAKVGIKMLRGLFKEGVERAARQASFGYGFPNKAAYKVGKRLLGYKDLGRMGQFFKRLSLRCAVKRRLPAMAAPLLWPTHKLSQPFYTPSLSKGEYTVEEVSEFGGSLDKLWDELKGEFRITAVRDSAYLNWRYKGRGYSILIARQGQDVAGYAVLKMDDSGDDKVGRIIDMLSKKEAAASVLNSALKFFIQKDADYCLCAMSAGSPMVRYLKEAGFEGDKGFESFPIVYVGRTQEEENNFLMNIDNWHLTYGDTDGF